MHGAWPEGGPQEADGQLSAEQRGQTCVDGSVLCREVAESALEDGGTGNTRLAPPAPEDLAQV